MEVERNFSMATQDTLSQNNNKIVLIKELYNEALSTSVVNLV